MPTTKKFYGYQGFTPTHLVTPPASKYGVGTREFLMNKYSTVGQGQVYKKKVISSARSFSDRTLNSDSFDVESKDFKRADRRGVSALHESEDPKTRSKKFLGTTTYEETYRNFTKEAKSILGTSIDDYLAPYESLMGADGQVGLKQIQKMLNLVAGEVVAGWISIKFLKTFDHNSSGQFTFEELEAALPTIIHAIKHDTAKNTVGQPEWLIASKKMPPKVLTNGGVRSAMQIDFGMADTNPADRPYTYKTGMYSSSQDMLLGTTRDTYHIPGYAGHIPFSKRNPVVMEQGEMKVPRPTKNNLRLIFSHDLPGYTGHQPRAARNDVGRKTGGLDPRTTSGSAATGMDIL